MTPYKNYSRFYDVVEGEKPEYVDFIYSIIERFNPNTKSILELGCGTGYVMSGLWKKGMKVEGLDNSKDMLSVAKKRKIDAKYYNQDITKFTTGKKYDTIISVYDTFNHILTLDDWDKSFALVKKHLTKGGLFLFDINTLRRLIRLSKNDPYTVYLKNGVFIGRITKVESNIFTWEINIFNKEKSGKYELYKDEIKELGVQVNDVTHALKKHFNNVMVFDGEDFLLKPNSERVYFACT